MNSFQIENNKALKAIKQKKRFLENKLKVKLEIISGKIILKGDALSKYEALNVLRAIGKGFPIETGLLLLDENYVFEIINIKALSPRKDLSQVRARIIGRKGKTLKILEELADCNIVLKDNQVYIIGLADNIKNALNGIRKLIQGSRQSSTYSYLERQRKIPEPLDFGLKIKLKR